MPYYFKLPVKFLLWYFAKIPLRILKIGKMLLVVIDNKMSFIANIKLLFVPLFGISNFGGRVVSFFARVFMAVFGLIFMILFLVVWAISPLFWFIIPLLITQLSSKIYILLYFILILFWFYLSTKNKPDKNISQITSKNSQTRAFRPETFYFIKKYGNDYNSMLENLFQLKGVIFLMKKAELDIDSFKAKISNSPHIKIDDLVQNCFDNAVENKSRYVELEHLFLTVVEHIPNINTVLSTFNSSIENIKRTLFWIVEEKDRLSKTYIWQEDYDMPPTGGTGKGMLGRTTPNLDTISTDITKEVKSGKVKDIVGRESEIKKIAEILDGDKNDIILIGESGIGKTSIIKGIAYKIMTGTEYKTLKNMRIVRLDTGSLVSSDGAGKVAEKLVSVLNEVEGSGDIILFIDEIQNLITGMGEESGDKSSILSILEGHVAKDKIRIIGTTSMSNYRKFIEPNDAVSRLFQVIKIDESTKEETTIILQRLSTELEKEHGIIITYPAIISCIDLSEKLIHDRVLPDKAIDIIERTATSVKNNSKYLTSEEIAKEISEITDVPMTAVSRNETEKLLRIGTEMKKRVIGQDQAIEKIEIALQRARTGMRNESKPIAGFLFVGMTGVGKTETAKALLNSYFGEEENMIRMDMSEYQQIDSLNRIIGTTDGSTTGTMSERVRNKPFSLILIDEIEKAHPNILLTFLQILDEGRLTDTAGNEIDFTNTIIIATSNVGTKSIQKVSETGGSYERMQELSMAELREKFAPEFLNRFTSIVVFNPLSMENLRSITKLMLERVKGVAKEKGIEINFKPEIIEELIKRGYSPEWGARPMSRVIEDSIESYIALKILKKEINSGDRLMLGTEVFGI